MKYKLLTLLLISCLLGCDKGISLQDKYEEPDEGIITPKYEIPLSKEEIQKNIEGIDLSLSGGVHGEDSSVYVTLENLFGNNVDSKRYFSYVIPNDINNGYKILFEFHGNGNTSLRYLELKGVYKSSTFSSGKNTIVINPLGSVVSDAKGVKTVGWYLDNGDMYYVDILVELFKKLIKQKLGYDMDEKNVFVTGQSSGAIFSWGLAYYRNGYISASVPRFGAYTVDGTMIKNPPEYKVPIRIFCGKDDKTVLPISVGSNARRWSEIMLKLKSTYKGTLSMPLSSGAKTVEIVRWSQSSGGLLETYLVQSQGHGFSSNDLQSIYDDYIWKFMLDNMRK